MIGVRGMGYEENVLEVKAGDRTNVFSQKTGSFGWNFFETDLPKGNNLLTVTNKNGVQIINTVAIVPLEVWEDSESKTNQFLEKFSNNTEKKDQHWLISSQNYHPMLKLDCGNSQIDPIPVYSMINGYNLTDCGDLGNIYFEGQKYVDLGIKISLVSLVCLMIFFLKTRKIKKV